MKEGAVNLSLQELNTYTAHQAHQSERAAQQKIAAASGQYPGHDYGDMQIEPDADDAVTIASLSGQ